jgi:hypothetical protein
VEGPATSFHGAEMAVQLAETCRRNAPPLIERGDYYAVNFKEKV